MGKGKPRLTSGSRAILVLAAAVIVIGGIRVARVIITPFIFAMFLAVILYAPLRYMRQRGVPTWIAMLVLTLAVGGIGFGTGTLIGNSATQFFDQQEEIKTQLENEKDRMLDWLKGFGIDATGLAEGSPVDPQTVVGYLATGLTELLKGFTQSFLILIMVIFMLLEAPHFRRKLKMISNDDSNAVANADEITANVRRYLSIKTFTSGLTGVLIWGWVSVLGIDYAIIFGLTAFLLNYVPNVGSVIAAIPAILLALVQFGVENALLCGMGYAAVNCGVSYIIEPRFMGHGLRLSVLVVFLSLIFWGWVLGPAGMFLSAPLTMIVKIILYGGEDTRWIGVLMGGGRALDAELAAFDEPPVTDKGLLPADEVIPLEQ